MIDSVFKTGKHFFPQVFLEECRYVIKKIPKYIIDDLEIFSDSDIERSDEENLFEKSRWKKILIIEKILIRKFWKKFRWKKILMKKIK